MPQLVKAEAPFYPVHKGIRHFHTSKGQKQKGHRAKKNILSSGLITRKKERNEYAPHTSSKPLFHCCGVGATVLVKTGCARARPREKERKKLKNERKEENKTGGDRARRA